MIFTTDIVTPPVVGRGAAYALHGGRYRREGATPLPLTPVAPLYAGPTVREPGRLDDHLPACDLPAADLREAFAALD
jgi:hypothetical protein